MESVEPTTTDGSRRIMLVLAYSWLLAVVPLLTEERDTEIQWHARHGLVLLFVEGLACLPFALIYLVSGSILGSAFSWSVLPASLAIPALHLAAIAKALQGSRLVIAGISRLSDRL